MYWNKSLLLLKSKWIYIYLCQSVELWLCVHFCLLWFRIILLAAGIILLLFSASYSHIQASIDCSHFVFLFAFLAHFSSIFRENSMPAVLLFGNDDWNFLLFSFGLCVCVSLLLSPPLFCLLSLLIHSGFVVAIVVFVVVVVVVPFYLQ